MSEPVGSRALDELAQLLRSATKRRGAAELQPGLVALRTRIAARGAGADGRFRWALLAAAVLCVAASGLTLASVFRRSSGAPDAPVLAYWIEGGKMLEGGYLSESGNAGVKLLFSEGSSFHLTPGTRGRLRDIGPHGAHFAVEHGTAAFQITHRPEHRWSVEAGPFLVAVEGTDFSVHWEPAAEQFELRLRRGRVSVSGPLVGQHLALRAGQKLTVSLPKAETVITEDRPAASQSAESAPSAPAPNAATAAEALALPAPAPASPVPSSGSTRRFREAFAKGQWDRILAEVERDGLEATLSSASSEDLFALADAARYRRRADLARAALSSHRRRFPGSPRSLDAIFLLGRVEELRESGSAPAIRWYDEYLARAPGGTYAAEALGRKMILTNEMSGPASARAIAEEYLRRFPGGSHAGAARAIQRAP
jgi:ferric-dicitrate binding protein FerR (iron transport regulator)